MLKGIQFVNFGNTLILHFKTSENVLGQTILSQDTTKIIRKTGDKPQLNITRPALSSPGITVRPNIPAKNFDSIFLQSERREKDLIKPKKIAESKPEINLTEINPEDTSSIKLNHPYYAFKHDLTITDKLHRENFLLGIPTKNLSEFQNFSPVQFKDTLALVGHDTLKSIHPKDSSILLPKMVTASKSIPVIMKPQGIDGTLRSESSLNWLVGLLLISLFVFSWMKILYQKYMVQEIVSLINYQASLRLQREKNILFKNLSIGLSVVFSINMGLFIYFLISYFHLTNLFQSEFYSVLFYCFAVAAFYSVKSLLCHTIGYLFLSQSKFSEYIHNITVFNKNTGLFLFPIVVMFPYVAEQIKPVVLYTGIVLLLGIFILRILRGFQIILHQGVSTFYLILYLCAVEILPILLIVKYSSTLI